MPIRIGGRPDHGFDQPLGLLSDCHRRIESFLDQLIAISERATKRPLSASERPQLDAALTYFATAAPMHTADEEDSLFPRLRASGDPQAIAAVAAIARLESDHQEADAHHRAVDALVRGWMANDRIDDDDRRSLGDHLSALQRIYRQHIAVEDRELFPAAGRVLATDQISAIGREMADRRSTRRRQV